MIEDPTVTNTTAGTTSIATTQGKARGSGQWGYVGDIETRVPGATGQGSNVYTYGVDISPFDDSVWVTDSGKIGYSTLACLFLASPKITSGSNCLSGTPRVYRYENTSSDWATGNYGNDGVFTAVVAGDNAGIGANWQTAANRTTITTGTTGVFGGPRGVTVTDDGSAWVVDPDYASPFLTSSDGRHAVRIFGADGTEGASFGTSWPSTPIGWANRHDPTTFDYPAAIARMTNGHLIVTSQTPELLKEYETDGTFVRNIYLHQTAGTAFAGDPGYRSPYSVAVDPADGTLLVGYIDPGSGNQSHIERIDPNDCTTEAVSNPAGSSRDRCTVLATIGLGTLTSGNGNPGTSPANTFAIAVDPLTSDIYVSQRNGQPYIFASDGTFKGRFSGYGTGTNDGQVSNTVRGVAFDSRGFMYVTVGEGTASTRVQIFARTPDPITTPTANYTDASLTEGTVSWDALPTASTAEGKTALRDYTIEVRESSDNGATWSMWAISPKPAASTNNTRTITGLDPAKRYEFRIAGWNEAGNGDTAVVPLNLPASTLTVVKKGNGTETATADDAVQVDADSTVLFEYVVTNNGPSKVTDVELSDSVLGDITTTDPADFDGTLDVGESVKFTASGPVAAGAYQNTATATGVSQGEDIEAEDTWYGFGVTRGLTIVKTGNGVVATTVDDAVDVSADSNVVFNYTVTNTGNVPVTGLTLEDSVIGVITAPTGFDGTLAANGGSVTFSATGPVAAGAYQNTATADGTSAGQPVTAETDWHGFGVTSELSVVKTGNTVANDSADAPLYVDADTVVSFAYRIHNGGNTPVEIDSVIDSMLGVLTAPTSFDGTLAAGGEVTYTASGTVPAGAYTNTVTVEATGQDGAVLSATDDWHGFGVTTGLTVVKTGNGEERPDAADPLVVLTGDSVAFEYEIVNTSNVPVTISSVIDTVTGPATAPAGFSGVLAANGGSVTYTSSGTIPAGTYENTVNVTATAAGVAQLEASDVWHGFGLTPVTPEAPTVVDAVCVTGTLTGPTVTPATTTGITYSVEGDVTAGGTVSVNAVAADGYTLRAADGWVLQADGTATFAVELAQVPCDPASPGTNPNGNTGQPILPITGAPGNGMLLGLGSLALLVAGAGLILFTRRQRNRVGTNLENGDA